MLEFNLITIVSFVGMIIGLINSIYLMRGNISSNQERKWKELKEWQEKIDYNFTTDNNIRWDKLVIWKDKVNERLERDYERLNTHANFLKKRGEFEELVLLSLGGILKTLTVDNGSPSIQKLADRLETYTASLGRLHAEHIDE
ncbi:MAG: hypothetical protein LBD57_04555 [Endomicrobium sp.]|jgi:pyruvate/2-oxoglutarate dehydrogenase complex dihydrolipoamide dehydrogenase (E3) component|nr:hypothetical protein [Endomicrobium sp.]